MPKPPRTTVFFEPNGDHANPKRGAGRNFALFSASAEEPTIGFVLIVPFESNAIVRARPSTSFQPFVDSPRNPIRISRRWLQVDRVLGVKRSFERPPAERRDSSAQKCKCSRFLAEMLQIGERRLAVLILNQRVVGLKPLNPRAE